MPRPNAGTKGVPRADREEQILETATRLFGTLGFAATSVAAVAEPIGISKPMVYSYFGSKDRLYGACLRRAGEQLAVEMERIARTGVVGLERGLRTLDGIFVLLEPQPWMWRMLFDPTAPREGEAAEVMASYTARITALAHEGVGELMSLVGVTDALDVSAMVSVWISIFDSLVDWWLDHPDQDAAAMTQRCVRLFAAVTRADLGSVLA
ncbi:TetR/AcrR family transcriptional regulator [Nocardioides sp.]|jgi:AcrR family transcriptional regulator|uniref:TetR/AcrR family transcriptional regulator n=1 Tax=Nocardioides sp. TaxID=35761 RepID=UPI002C216E15|nr:TetR/AcrR family transcriptional regulator [Nocardioides sp.]HVX54525.1 TetR/AcrR family transcriptional regulator [Nocardioides sp.]